MAYNWQLPDWPNFTFSRGAIESLLFNFAQKTGHLAGILEGLPPDSKSEAIIEIMVAEAIKTSEIEGEFLSRKDVMSSIRRNLGLTYNHDHLSDQRSIGAAELMINVRESLKEPLSKDMLFLWHSMIMKGSKGINIGQWRTHSEPMQVISGSIGKEKVHFEAPPSNLVPGEMNRFIYWFNETVPRGPLEIQKAPIHAAIAHVYFESIHPFEDGNGRIGRAISEKALSQGIGQPALMSLSRAIEAKRGCYYDALKTAQKSNNITRWIEYFVKMINESQIQSQELLQFTLRKVNFFDQYKNQLNKRQLRVLKRMMEEGPLGFEGGMSAKKYMAIAKTTKATATRDLQQLLLLEAFKTTGGGRSTRYEINFNSW